MNGIMFGMCIVIWYRIGWDGEECTVPGDTSTRPVRQEGHISEPWMGLRMKPVLTSEDKKKVKKFLRLNLSLVTVTNDKFFFFKMTWEFLFQEMDLYSME